ncbi:hypothetical protein B0H65DRAFT_549619 [Neurospora tetraspora]|uniref:Uncharacterized protein n=1 Tax=Neurospora tetraspora TaxID=94610 RepID=A0AAE0JC93_9PEZI|nr:hypothetical protein B0H65DRAFT_549619 [Neurospora tetraspora]
MPPGIRTSISRNNIKYNSAWVLSFLTTSLVLTWPHLCLAIPSPSNGQPDLSPRGNNNPLNIDWDPAPAPEDGPPLSRGAIRDPAYLPAQIGGIVGSYAVSLVIVAILLLVLSKGRRQALINADLPDEDKYLNFNPLPAYLQQTEEEFKQTLAQFHQQELGEQFYQQQQEQGQFLPPLPTLQIPQSPYRNWGFREGPLSASRSQHSVISAGSPTSTVLAAGYDLSVDQTVIRHDRAMAQQQLEEMYKHVMEQEEAKAEGRQYIPPNLPRPSVSSFASQQQQQQQAPGTIRKNKPSNLNLSKEKEEKQSRGSSLLNFLKSPKKNKAPQGLSISSPIMTPMSGTFPRGYHPDVDGQEMNPIPPRHYAPAKPPPIPSDVLPFRRQNSGQQGQYPTPDISPVSTQSIDQRIDIALHRPPQREGSRSDERLPSHVRDPSAASNASSLTGDAYLADPPSAVSERSTSGLVSGTVGLPSSPRPGVNRFPSLDSTRTLPSSPKPGASFSSSRSGASGTSSTLRPNAPAPLNSLNGNASSSAVRAGGALPLRAYEPSLASPTSGSQTTKQTVFTRQANGPLSPGMNTAGLRTPWTGAPVPYSPYQPFSPVVPITPSLVTKADRKRMKRFEPKTPTVEMVRSEEEIW